MDSRQQLKFLLQGLKEVFSQAAVESKEIVKQLKIKPEEEKTV